VKAQPLKYWNDATGTGYQQCLAAEATHLRLAMPGPMLNRILPITLGEKTQSPQWTWNGDTEKPTLRPSILSRSGRHVCHSFVTNGIAEFCSDCTHKLAGMSAELLDIE